ncbi:hypothetical protein AND_005422 [Anopheles darlingi]|uniref:Secreted protein n=1 Tax=Anopheles darlingi TaxID=43151 RepID=W5JEU2_ANODA|nr:hypothetical protein AND_005422 [Anopheles darlingi]
MKALRGICRDLWFVCLLFAMVYCCVWAVSGTPLGETSTSETTTAANGALISKPNLSAVPHSVWWANHHHPTISSPVSSGYQPKKEDGIELTCGWSLLVRPLAEQVPCARKLVIQRYRVREATERDKTSASSITRDRAP